MIVRCSRCFADFDDRFRWTNCPHETFPANDGTNNFAHHPESMLSRACGRMGEPAEACDGTHLYGTPHNDNLACATPPCTLHGRGRFKCAKHRPPALALAPLTPKQESALREFVALIANGGECFHCCGPDERCANVQRAAALVLLLEAKETE